ncbi:MAG: amidohydrolase family protein [Acidobacteriota bacterium]|nr:amidohydrolase family protein [Acidobacteriota bacterium]
MRFLPAALLCVFAFAVSADDVCYVNGRWYDGKGFRARTMCASNGIFTKKRVRGAREVDLAGAYVIPPFAEAHNHNVEGGGERLEATIRGYLDKGVFYVKNPNNLPRTTPRDLVNKPTSIDATFAMGGLTGTDGHPVELVKRNVDRGAWTMADGDGGFYFAVDSLADLDRKWPQLLVAKPDFVKTYLVYSEEYRERKNDPSKSGWKGLDPEVLPEIARRAHAAGLRVSTHVETATDFHNAVMAGVDEINHLPGFRLEKYELSMYDHGRFHISDADAKLAAKRGITVVTTSGALIQMASDASKGDDVLRAVMRQTIIDNLQTLRRAGVKLAIGSDDYRNGVVPEVNALRTLGIFSNRELLDLWTRDTARAIFPNRKIGRLASGYEASFLALAGDPIADFANTQRIKLRVKQGVELGAAAGAAAGVGH